MTDSAKPDKWYHAVVSVIIALVLVGPLAYPLLWKSPKFNLFWKILLTIIFTAATIYLIVETWVIAQYILNEFKQLGLI